MKIFKTLLFVSIILIISSNLFSQVVEKKSLNDKKGFIGICLGPSMPTGKFASSDLNDSLAGFANTGAIFELNIGYRLGKNLGIAVALRGQSNPFDETTISNSFLFTGYNFDIDADNWGIGGFLAGLYTTVPTSATLKTSFDARFLVGFVNASTPRLRITLTDPLIPATVWSEQNSVSGSAFGILFGAGFRFNVSESISIITNADFFIAEPEFNDIKVTSSAGDVTYFDLNQSMTTFNLTAGIGFRIN